MLESDKKYHEPLPKGRCKGCEHGRETSAGNWSFLGCYCKPYKGKWVAEIKDCPKKEEANAERY